MERLSDRRRSAGPVEGGKSNLNRIFMIFKINRIRDITVKVS